MNQKLLSDTQQSYLYNKLPSVGLSVFVKCGLISGFDKAVNKCQTVQTLRCALKCPAGGTHWGENRIKDSESYQQLHLGFICDI